MWVLAVDLRDQQGRDLSENLTGSQVGCPPVYQLTVIVHIHSLIRKCHCQRENHEFVEAALSLIEGLLHERNVHLLLEVLPSNQYDRPILLLYNQLWLVDYALKSHPPLPTTDHSPVSSPSKTFHPVKKPNDYQLQ